MSADPDVHYFSNGTEGQIWMNEWCNRCSHDHGTHKAEWGAEDGCEHITGRLGSGRSAFVTDDLMPGVWRDVVLDELTPSFT